MSCRAKVMASARREGNLLEEERQMLISVFHSADERHNGHLRREDIKVAVVHLFGYKPSKYELDQMLGNLGHEVENEEYMKNVVSYPQLLRCILHPVLYSLNLKKLTHAIAALWSNRGITQEEFLTIMVPKLRATDEDEEIRQIFLAFDSQCRGFIGLDDLHKAFAQVAPHMAAHSIVSAFREIDRDGDGRVSFKDFEFMMKYSKENGF